MKLFLFGEVVYLSLVAEAPDPTAEEMMVRSPVVMLPPYTGCRFLIQRKWLPVWLHALSFALSFASDDTRVTWRLMSLYLQKKNRSCFPSSFPSFPSFPSSSPSPFSCYCLSYQNGTQTSWERAKRMQQRFATIGWPLCVHRGVAHTDPRLAAVKDDAGLRRLWSCTYGHLDNLARFLRNDDHDENKGNLQQRFCVLCEDDVHVSHKLGWLWPQIQEYMVSNELDVFLLGYLYPHDRPMFQEVTGFDKYTCYRYPGDLWGIQLAVFSATHVATLVSLFAEGYAERTLADPTLPAFSPDWILTKTAKEERRALVYPMLAVEERMPDAHYDDAAQKWHHARTHELHYDARTFL